MMNTVIRNGEADAQLGDRGFTASTFRMTKRAVSLSAIAALLAGCATAAQRQYPAIAHGGFASEECLAAVTKLHERYGMVARSHGVDVEALRQCGLPLSYGGGSPAVSAPANTTVVTEGAGEEEVQLERMGGVFAVPVMTNQSITIPFVLDSGAAEVQLPAEVVFTLIRTGTLSEADFLGEGSYVHASGATFRSPRFNIREMRLGGHVVRNVAATVGPAIRSDALLGQSFLSKLPSWTLDNKRHVLILAR